MELGKVPSSTEKGKGRNKPKEGEGDRFEETKKELVGSAACSTSA